MHIFSVHMKKETEWKCHSHRALLYVIFLHHYSGWCRKSQQQNKDSFWIRSSNRDCMNYIEGGIKWVGKERWLCIFLFTEGREVKQFWARVREGFNLFSCQVSPSVVRFCKKDEAVCAYQKTGFTCETWVTRGHMQRTRNMPLYQGFIFHIKIWQKDKCARRRIFVVLGDWTVSPQTIFFFQQSTAAPACAAASQQKAEVQLRKICVIKSWRSASHACQLVLLMGELKWKLADHCCLQFGTLISSVNYGMWAFFSPWWC